MKKSAQNISELALISVVIIAAVILSVPTLMKKINTFLANATPTKNNTTVETVAHPAEFK